MVTPREAEVAAENYWLGEGFTTRRALRTKFAKVDFFGADVLGKSGWSTIFCQVTKGKNPGSKRRKLEKPEGIWLETDRRLVFELRTLPNPVNRSVHDYYFRVHELLKNDKWIIWPEPIKVPRDWFKVKK